MIAGEKAIDGGNTTGGVMNNEWTEEDDDACEIAMGRPPRLKEFAPMKIEERNVRGNELSMPIPSLPLARRLGEKSIALETEKVKTQDQAETITKTQIRPTHESEPGSSETENESERITGDSMPAKKKKCSQKNTLVVREETQPTGSRRLSTIAPPEKLRPMNLIDDSLKHMRKLMKGVTNNLPENSERLYDVDRVQTACLCARQITDLLRVKIELINLSRNK